MIKVIVNSGGLPFSKDICTGCHLCAYVKPILPNGNHPICGNKDSEYYNKDVRSWNTCKLWKKVINE